MLNNITFDTLFNDSNTNTKAGEVHDYCNIVSAILHMGRSNKYSIMYGVTTEDNKSFVIYSALTDKAAEFTVKRMVQILTKSVGKDKAEAIFNKCNDESVESYEDLAKELVNKVDKSLHTSPVRVYVDRVKEGEFWNVKWYFSKPDSAAANIQV